jgi:hypothetical protein
VWVVTGSGHVVRLDPCANQIGSYKLPAELVAQDPFGIAPDDDVVGYTKSAAGVSKVGMLIPKRRAVAVTFSDSTATKLGPTAIGQTCLPSKVTYGWVCPVGKTVTANVAKDPTAAPPLRRRSTRTAAIPRESARHHAGEGQKPGAFFLSAVGTNASTT